MEKWIGDRISIVDQDKSTTIVIHPIRVWWKEILLTLWVVSFTFIGLYMLYQLLTGFVGLNYMDIPTEEELDNQRIYAIVFLGFWGYFEFKTVKALLWYRFGKELLRLDLDGMTIKKSILSYGKANRYFFENIKKFGQRKQEETSFGQFFENAYWSMGTDALSFSYMGKEKSFGRRLNDKDSRLLMRLIDDRIKKLLKQSRKRA
ncbi:hypothetical protein [Crocinitomix algicola]|uniref:hypothetical protein n=1 Tax=Crocinitomix algicola TaxID=1740263 RepID=UPI00082BE953|nr:hypothetical protein [Crocinitomix algicola]